MPPGAAQRPGVASSFCCCECPHRAGNYSSWEEAAWGSATVSDASPAVSCVPSASGAEDSSDTASEVAWVSAPSASAVSEAAVSVSAAVSEVTLSAAASEAAVSVSTGTVS